MARELADIVVKVSPDMAALAKDVDRAIAARLRELADEIDPPSEDGVKLEPARMFVHPESVRIDVADMGHRWAYGPGNPMLTVVKRGDGMVQVKMPADSTNNLVIPDAAAASLREFLS